MWFQDLWNYDFRRTEMCVIPYGTQEGEISFCAYNTGVGWRNIIEEMRRWRAPRTGSRRRAGTRSTPATVRSRCRRPSSASCRWWPSRAATATGTATGTAMRPRPRPGGRAAAGLRHRLRLLRLRRRPSRPRRVFHRVHGERGRAVPRRALHAVVQPRSTSRTTRVERNVVLFVRRTRATPPASPRAGAEQAGVPRGPTACDEPAGYPGRRTAVCRQVTRRGHANAARRGTSSARFRSGRAARDVGTAASRSPGGAASSARNAAPWARGSGLRRDVQLRDEVAPAEQLAPQRTTRVDLAR